MSELLEDIRRISRDAAKVLEKADLRNDSDIWSLTREDLHELFPGAEKFKLRRKIFEMTQKRKQVKELLKELSAFIPHEHLKAALTGNGVLVDYLRMLKDIKAQIENVKEVVDAHIGYLEESSTDQPDQQSDKGSWSDGTLESGVQSQEAQETSGASSPMVPCHGPAGGHTQEAKGTPDTRGSKKSFSPGFGVQRRGFQTTVMYQTVVSGKTFDADKQLMQKVRNHGPNHVQFVENNGDHQVSIVFCPITSRIGSDVAAAMDDVKDDKPVILVLMHHSREVKPTASLKTWSEPNIMSYVNVFYHETVHGLLACQENNLAVSTILQELLKYSTQRQQVTCGNVLGAGAEMDAKGGGQNDGSSGSKSSSRNSSWTSLSFVFGSK